MLDKIFGSMIENNFKTCVYKLRHLSLVDKIPPPNKRVILKALSKNKFNFKSNCMMIHRGPSGHQMAQSDNKMIWTYNTLYSFHNRCITLIFVTRWDVLQLRKFGVLNWETEVEVFPTLYLPRGKRQNSSFFFCQPNCFEMWKNTMVFKRLW